jgi:hypothetical protein
MSIAVQHASPTRSTAIAEVDAGRQGRPSPARAADRDDRAPPNSRHAVLGVIADAVAALLAADPAAAQPADEHAAKRALHGFVHALLAELRPSGAEGGPGRGFAWGRTSAATLGQRLDALVARLQAGSATVSAATTTDATAATAVTPAIDATAATAATPPATSESTSTATAPAAPAPSAAPASPLLTAFRELATARGAGGGDSATSDALIAMLQRIASALGGDAGTLASPAGGLLDTTA